MNGYNFTERTRHVLASAREEAVRLRHEYVGTEHLLLALMRDEGGVATAALEELGVHPPRVAAMLGEVVTPGTAAPRHDANLPYTSRGKKTLELAMAAARELRHEYIGAEHLLIGLLDEEKGIAAQALAACGARRPAVVAAIVRLLGSPREPNAPPAPPAPAPLPPGVEQAMEAAAWARLTHALDVTSRLGATPWIELTDDGALLVSLGADLAVRVEFSRHVEIRRRG